MRFCLHAEHLYGVKHTGRIAFFAVLNFRNIKFYEAFLFKKGGSVAEDRLVPFQKTACILPLSDLFQCIQAVIRHMGFLSGTFGLNDDGTAVVSILDQNIWPTGSLFRVGSDFVAGTGKKSGSESMIIIFPIVEIADGCEQDVRKFLRQLFLITVPPCLKKFTPVAGYDCVCKPFCHGFGKDRPYFFVGNAKGGLSIFQTETFRKKSGRGLCQISGQVQDAPQIFL